MFMCNEFIAQRMRLIAFIQDPILFKETFQNVMMNTNKKAPSADCRCFKQLQTECFFHLQKVFGIFLLYSVHLSH